MTRNLILSTDSYKHSHYLQYPEGAQRISSYVEARVGGDLGTSVMFFGLQAFLIEYLTQPITQQDINQADILLTQHGLPFNREGWEIILNDHGGLLPLHIEALPEGSLVPCGIPLIQVTNTDPRLPWLTSFIETIMLRATWYATTVATFSAKAKLIIWAGLQESSDDPEAQIPFKLHDFGARGTSSAETAGLGGAAHLLNFLGTDTLEALVTINKYYGSGDAEGYSIPASEHSTMTSWGRDREADAYENMIDKFGHGLVSVVSDSYDLFNAVDFIFGHTLADKILKMNGTLVVRPDSGNPVTTPLAVIRKLWDAFGGTINSKGYKVLNPKVRVIQGDGMSLEKIEQLINAMLDEGFSIDNIAFGMGGKLLQAHSRDDYRFAMKANAIMFDNGWLDVQKNPATDPSKASKAGRQAVVMRDGRYVSVRAEDRGNEINLLQTVCVDGAIERTVDWHDLRQFAEDELLKGPIGV